MPRHVQLPERAFAGVHLLHHLAGLSHGLVRIVVKRGILQEFPGCSFALVQFVRDDRELVHGGVGFIVERVVIDSLPRLPWPAPTLLTIPACRQPSRSGGRREMGR